MILIKDLFKLNNKKILITGVSGQLGEKFAKLYLNNGCIVYGIDKNVSRLKHRNFYFIKKDLSNLLNIRSILDQIIKKEKKIDIILNNAAVSFFTKIEKRNLKEVDETFEVNLKSVINIITEYYKVHKKKKLNSCRIINIGSIYGVNSPDFKIYSKNDRFSSEIYGATKAGVIQITKYFAVLLAKNNIIVNSISPGGITNDKLQNKKFQKKYSKLVPMQRMANVNDIFTAIIFLSSDHTKYVTGQNIIIDGGLSAK